MNGDLKNIVEVVKEVTGVDPRTRGSDYRGFSESKQIYIHIAKSLNYRPNEISEHIGVSLAQVYRHIKTFESVLQLSPELRTQTEACFFKVNNMLKLDNFDYLDRLMFFWDDLTIKQRAEITEIAENFHVKNTHANQEIYV